MNAKNGEEINREITDQFFTAERSEYLKCKITSRMIVIKTHT